MDSCTTVSDDSALTVFFIASTNFGKSSGGSSARALLMSFCFANIALSTLVCVASFAFPVPLALLPPTTEDFIVLSLLPPALSNLNAKDPVALNLFTQKDLIDAIEKAERRIKREKKEKERQNKANLASA